MITRARGGLIGDDCSHPSLEVAAQIPDGGVGVDGLLRSELISTPPLH